MSMLLAFMATLGKVTLDVAAGTYIGLPGSGSSYALESDGDIIAAVVGDVGDWITPKGKAPGAYECRATLNSGSVATGTTGSWLALTSTRTWTVGVSGSANLTIEIRLGSTVLASGTVIISGGGPI